MLRTDILARLLVERLLSLGPISEAEAIDALELRAPGRGQAAVTWARQAGLIRRVKHADGTVTLEAAGAPRALAA